MVSCAEVVMKVSELMTRDVRVCRADESLAHAAELMWEHDCGIVPVVDDARRVEGVVTDRDICMAALHNGRPLHELLVTQAMARKPVFLTEDDDVTEAHELMRRARVRRLPVIDVQERLVGILSIQDLARAATGERRIFAGRSLRRLAATFAQVSRPWNKPAPSSGARGARSTAYAE